MFALQMIGIICWVISFFSLTSAGILHNKIKQFISLISEEHMESAIPIIEEQKKRVRVHIIVGFILLVVGTTLFLIGILNS